MNIMKNHTIVIGVDDFCRDFTFHNFAEQAVFAHRNLFKGDGKLSLEGLIRLRVEPIQLTPVPGATRVR
jgi:hypothetical protein